MHLLSFCIVLFLSSDWLGKALSWGHYVLNCPRSYRKLAQFSILELYNTLSCIPFTSFLAETGSVWRHSSIIHLLCIALASLLAKTGAGSIGFLSSTYDALHWPGSWWKLAQASMGSLLTYYASYSPSYPRKSDIHYMPIIQLLMTSFLQKPDQMTTWTLSCMSFALNRLHSQVKLAQFSIRLDQALSMHCNNIVLSWDWLSRLGLYYSVRFVYCI